MRKIEKIKNNPTKLIKVLQEGGYEERAKAAYYLGELRDSKNLPQLKASISDPVPVVVKEVVLALKKIGIDAETEKQITERLQQQEQLERKMNDKTKETWREKTEEEKQAELKEYAAHSHIRQAQQQLIRQDEGSNKSWLIAAIVFGVVSTIAIIMKYLFA